MVLGVYVLLESVLEVSFSLEGRYCDFKLHGKISCLWYLIMNASYKRGFWKEKIKQQYLSLQALFYCNSINLRSVTEPL